MKQLIVALIVITNIYENLDYENINVYSFIEGGDQEKSEPAVICREWNYILGEYIEYDCDYD